MKTPDTGATVDGASVATLALLSLAAVTSLCTASTRTSPAKKIRDALSFKALTQNGVYVLNFSRNRRRTWRHNCKTSYYVPAGVGIVLVNGPPSGQAPGWLSNFVSDTLGPTNLAT